MICPVGPYAGPYDQNEKLKLNIQLPLSDLDYRGYSEFIHDDTVDCSKFHIGANYFELNDLEKIDSLELKEIKSEKDEEDDEDDSDSDENLVYTCIKQKCEIPCLCHLCASRAHQCSEHLVKHPDLFDEEEDALCIRTSHENCNNEEFFETSYVNKYSGIPIQCQHCQRDLLHHKCFHLNFHNSCKFCKQNWYKLFPESSLEFQEKKKKEENYFRTVCPYCDKKFCEPYFAKKHIEFSHTGQTPFNCESCAVSFQSKQALEYHVKKQHTQLTRKEKCPVCQKTFLSKVSLENHIRYVHAEKRKYECDECKTKFKQKKSLRDHNLNVHGINQFKEEYHNNKETNKFKCSQCGRSYLRKKDLNYHVKNTHQSEDVDKSFTCDICETSFKQKKFLNMHVKRKHGQEETHACPKCGKLFNRKDNMEKHLYRHKFD